MEKQFITNSGGEKLAIILPIEEYNQLVEKAEELEDLELYNQAKKEDDGERVSFSDYDLI